jgi:hypothetical protein
MVVVCNSERAPDLPVAALTAAGVGPHLSLWMSAAPAPSSVDYCCRRQRR